MRKKLLTTPEGKATGLTPEVSAAPVVDVKACECKLHVGIAKGEKAISEGRVFTHEEAKIRMSGWLDSAP